MIDDLVRSAFQTGCLSVESEGLIRQILATSSCKSTDVEALRHLCEAVEAGKIHREAHQKVQLPSLATVGGLRQAAQKNASAF